MAFESGLLFHFFVLILVLFLTILAERASRPPFPSHSKAASLGGGSGLEGAKMALGLA